MFPLVEFPELVQHYAPHFRAVFSEEALIEFERYISGLIVSENKTVQGINRLFVVESRNQSSLNRLLTASPFTCTDLNQARLKLLQAQPGTALKRKGVTSVDDTLLIHYGHHLEKIALLRDPTTEQLVWAHNLVNLHYSDDETDYPLLFQLWEPPDLDKLEQGLPDAGVPLKAEKQVLKTEDPRQWRNYLLGVWRRHQHDEDMPELHQSKLRIAEHLLTTWVKDYPSLVLPVTFDAWYTQPAFCRFIDGTLKRPYVGALSDDDRLRVKNDLRRLDEFADQLKQEHLQAVQRQRAPTFKPITLHFKGHTEHLYAYCATHRLNQFGRQRLVISYDNADLSDRPAFYISNRLAWQAPGILRIRRHRWPVEVYHEEGKAEGLDQYQIRDFGGTEKHVALVAVVYSLLRAAQHDPALQHKLQRQLQFELDGSVPHWRRVTQAQSLWSLALFISAGLAQGQSLRAIMTPLLRALGAD